MKRIQTNSPGLKGPFLLNVPFFDKWNFIPVYENIDLWEPKTGCCHLLPFGQNFLRAFEFGTSIAWSGPQSHDRNRAKIIKNASKVVMWVLIWTEIASRFQISPIHMNAYIWKKSYDPIYSKIVRFYRNFGRFKCIFVSDFDNLHLKSPLHVYQNKSNWNGLI